MRKYLLTCLLAGALMTSQAVNKLVKKPFIEGRGMKGWVIDSILINDTATIAYGQFGLGKGWTASGGLNNYIEIPQSRQQFKQKGLRGLPIAPKQVTGDGGQIHFEYIFPPISPNTRIINITGKDFDGKGAAWYGIWLTPKTTIFSETLNNLEGLQGNWYTTDGSGMWAAGFFEKKIFWENEFWNFKVIKTVNNTAQLSLSSAKRGQMTILLSMNDNKQLTIDTKGKSLTLNHAPGYSQPDTSTFINAFTDNDSLTVSGYYQVADPVFSKQAALLVNSYISENPITYPIKVAQDGTFHIRIPFNHTSKVVFSNQLGPRSPLSEVAFMAEPGNHIFLTYRNEDEANVVFGGDNQRMNNEMQQFARINPYFVIDRQITDRAGSDFDSFVTWRNDQFEKIKAGYATWKQAHPNNAKFDSQMKLYLKYALSADIMKGMKYSRKNTSLSENLPISDPALYNEPDALVSAEFLDFLTGIQILQKRELSRIIPGEICNYLLKSAKPDQDEVNMLLKLDSLEKGAKNEESMKDFGRFLQDNKARIQNIFSKYQLALAAYQAEKQEEIKQKYPIPDSGLVNDLIIARSYGDMLATGETPLQPAQIDNLKLHCQNTYLRESVLKRNKEVEQDIEKIRSGKLPKGVNTYTIPETTSDLTSAILKNYKGKVVYIDFWATWCGPCRGELPYAEKCKETFKGKDVVYVYITGSSSPELTWKKMISEIPGEHFKLTEKQWKSICDQYQISGIPRYMIVNRKGKIEMNNAPRPSSAEALSTEIKKLL